MSSLLTVFLGWRTYPVALTLGLTKAFQSLKTGQLKHNVYCLVWRWGDVSADWVIFGWYVVTFGNQLAALCLELAKNMAADLEQEVDSEAVMVLLLST